MKRTYWLLPIVMFIPQVFMTLHTANQFRFEELIESVQSVYWFDHRIIISGLHVNVGWYAFLLLLYKLFGFSLYTGRIAYLVVNFVGLFALAILLRRFFDVKIASLLLCTIAFCPTLLFITALSMHWAMTIYLMIIIVLLLVVLDFKKRKLSLLITSVIFLLMMICWFFYQAVVFYLPSLFLFYLWKMRMSSRAQTITSVRGDLPHRDKKIAVSAQYNRPPRNDTLLYLAVAAVFFLLPVVMLFLYIKNTQMLIFDPQTGSGLFRGGGTFTLSDRIFSSSWSDFLRDFFVKGVSHHFEVAKADFSDVYPILTLIFVFGVCIKLLRDSRYKLYVGLAFLVICFDAVIFSTTSDLGLPGMKRVTPLLVSIYFLWVVVWHYFTHPAPSVIPVLHHEVDSPLGGKTGIQNGIGSRIPVRDDKKQIATSSQRARPRNDKRVIGIYLVLSLFTLHHLFVYPQNLAHIADPSPFKVADWFDEQYPEKSIDTFVSMAQKKDLKLDCRPITEKFGACTYDFIYPAVAGSCTWNNKHCHKILGYDTKTQTFIPLSIALWQQGYWDK